MILTQLEDPTHTRERSTQLVALVEEGRKEGGARVSLHVCGEITARFTLVHLLLEASNLEVPRWTRPDFRPTPYAHIG